MTEAIQITHLSKLDLFTPSPLHPHLPPLATGSYVVNGGTATMLSRSDVHARRNHIYAFLGDKVKNEKYMRVRPTTHQRIIKHMGIEYHSGIFRWINTGEVGRKEGRNLPKSMQSREARREFAAKGLEREWEAMGMDVKIEAEVVSRNKSWAATHGGMSSECAIELD
jgi:hypothetical protein